MLIVGNIIETTKMEQLATSKYAQSNNIYYMAEYGSNLMLQKLNDVLDSKRLQLSENMTMQTFPANVMKNISVIRNMCKETNCSVTVSNKDVYKLTYNLGSKDDDYCIKCTAKSDVTNNKVTVYAKYVMDNDDLRFKIVSLKRQ